MDSIRSELNRPPWRAESSPDESSSEPHSLILCCFKPCDFIQILFCSLDVVFAFSVYASEEKILDWPILDWPNSPLVKAGQVCDISETRISLCS